MPDPAEFDPLLLLADARLRAALADPHPFWLWSPDEGLCLAANEAGAALLGVEAFVGRAPAAALERALRNARPGPLHMLRLATRAAPTPLPASLAALTLGGEDVLLVRGLAPAPLQPRDPLRFLFDALAHAGHHYLLLDGTGEVLSASRDLPDVPALGARLRGRIGAPDGTVAEIEDESGGRTARHFELPRGGAVHHLFVLAEGAPSSGTNAAAAPRGAEASVGTKLPFETGPDGRLALLGESWNGLVSQDAVGAPLLSLFSSDTLGQALERRDTFSGVPARMTLPDGRVAELTLSALPIFRPPGTYQGLRGFARLDALIAQGADDEDVFDALPEAGRMEEGAGSVPMQASDGEDSAPKTPHVAEPEPVEGSPGLPAGSPDEIAPMRPGEGDGEPLADEPADSDDVARAMRAGNVVALYGGRVPTRGDGLGESDLDAFDRIGRAIEHEIRRRTAGLRDAEPRGAAQPDARSGGGTANAPASMQTRRHASTMAEQAALLDRLHSALAVIRDGRVAFANRTFFTILGAGDLAGFEARGGLEAVFPEGSLADGARESGLTIRRLDGTACDVDARVQTIPWGGETCLLLSLRERRDQAGATAELETRLADLQAVIDTTSDGVAILSGDGRIERLNRGAEMLFGVTSQEARQRLFVDLLEPESRAAAQDYLERLNKAGVESLLKDGLEVAGHVAGGGSIPLLLSLGPLGTGRQARLCAVLRDLGPFKAAHAELEDARRRGALAKGHAADMLGRINAELRTPLDTVLGLAAAIGEERFGPLGDERYRTHAREIVEGGTALLEMLDDLAMLARIEAGKLELAFKAVHLNELVQRCVATLAPEANRQRIILRTSLGQPVPPVVGDEASLEQVMLNLLAGAIRSTRPGGQVIVSTRLERSGDVQLAIRDDGVGASRAAVAGGPRPLPVPASIEVPAGSALSQSIAEALVEANRASLTIAREPDGGSHSRVVFPINRVLGP